VKATFEKLFAVQLAKISDDDLKQKVVDIWQTAAEQGGWTAEGLADIPFTLLTETHGVNLIQHTVAVTEGALGLAEAIEGTYTTPFKVNMDWLVAGGLLHDVGKLLENEYTNGEYRKSYSGRCARHPISGAILAAKAGMPEEIINIIGCHAKEGDGRPQRIETVLIHQADFATFNPMVMLSKGILIT
jgi:putative nucleotidyltransferase with HDIG domain